MDEAREYAKHHGGLEAVATLLRENHLRLDQVLLLGDVFSSQHIGNRAAFLDNARAFFRDAQILGATTVVACSTFGETDLSLAPTLFAELCDIAQPYGIRLSLEFIGWAKIINNLRTAWDIVEKAGRENGGILYDTFHHFFGGTPMADLEAVPTRYIFAVHIVDANPMPLSTLEISRKHRVFPGKGVIPIPDILRVLNGKGYNGSIALEIFNEAYWQRPPRELASEGYEVMLRIVSEAGFA